MLCTCGRLATARQLPVLRLAHAASLASCTEPAERQRRKHARPVAAREVEGPVPLHSTGKVTRQREPGRE